MRVELHRCTASGREVVLAEGGLRLVPGLWHGGPSASAFLRDKGARWAGSTWAWLWQGRGRQEQAPSGLETQAQHSHPPTYPRGAQDPTAAGRHKLSVGAMEGSRGEEKVSCGALAAPLSVLRSTAGPWI